MKNSRTVTPVAVIVWHIASACALIAAAVGYVVFGQK